MNTRILVIEDDIDISNGLKSLFESEGYGVELARNGRVALELLQAAAELPSLILLDLMMPIMDGFEFRERQLLTPALARIPVIIMTAGGSVEAKARALGARGYINKPIEIEAALAIVRDQLGVSS